MSLIGNRFTGTSYPKKIFRSRSNPTCLVYRCPTSSAAFSVSQTASEEFWFRKFGTVCSIEESSLGANERRHLEANDSTLRVYEHTSWRAARDD